MKHIAGKHGRTFCGLDLELAECIEPSVPLERSSCAACISDLERRDLARARVLSAASEEAIRVFWEDSE